jgi:hypothetical protein
MGSAICACFTQHTNIPGRVLVMFLMFPANSPNWKWSVIHTPNQNRVYEET